LVGCRSNTPITKPKALAAAALSDSGKPDPAIVGADSVMGFYNAGGIQFIRIDSLHLRIPDSDCVTRNNIYAGIYELNGDKMVRRKYLVTNKLLFLCTFDDVGMGYRARLFVYNLTQKRFIQDTSFDHEYLFSSAGMFVVDGNRIFVPGKSEWYDAKKEAISPASLYLVKNRYFQFVQNVYEKGDRSPNDTTGLFSFFKASISRKTNKVFSLPSDWWKVK
jgi:hypothetical protein